MNKSAIRNFAVTARIKLKDAVEQKAYALGITKDEISVPQTYEDGFLINGTYFKKYELEQRNKLIERIKEKGLEQVIEEVAYTWFNRFIAIRYMEVNEFLPIGVRVLSSQSQGKSEPDVISEVMSFMEDLELNPEIVYRLQDEQNVDDLFKYILIKQCNKLGEIMPMMFEKIQDYTELLLPDQLLSEGSVIRDLITLIEEENWQQVEIIGWLYQYYISEKKNEVFAELKTNKKISKENIPAATQLFTPKWIVKYLVENSLGRYWLETHPNVELQKEWKYYLEEADQNADVKEKIEKLKNIEMSPEDITIMDPCMGSGHMLVYAFDILYKIYQTTGYAERDIPALIIENNLYGLDIDDRAAQLAYFAIMMKARSYNRRFFRSPIEPNLTSIQESNGLPKEAIEYFVENLTDKEAAEEIINVFTDAKEYGSILAVKEINFDVLEHRLKEIKEDKSSDLFQEQFRDILLESIPALLKQAKIMSKKYDVVITNPPYMGNGNVNKKLNEYLKVHYATFNNDLYSVFIGKCIDYCKDSRFVSMITQHSWMFVSSFEALRKKIFMSTHLSSMAHLGPRAFEEISGEVVQTTAFILRKTNMKDFRAKYIKLNEYNTPKEKESHFLLNKDKANIISLQELDHIPKKPIAYWINEKTIQAFRDGKDIRSIIDDYSSGNKTANNEQYIRFVWEVDNQTIGKKWFLYAKGGLYRKWYGNLDNIVDWSETAQTFYKTNKSSSLLADRYRFKTGFTYTDLTSKGFNGRLLPDEALFDMSGPSILIENQINRNYLLALLNSKVAGSILELLNSSFHIKLNDLLRVPLILPDDSVKARINAIVEENIKISMEDWNSFENAKDFKQHPFFKYGNNSNLLEKAFENWQANTELQFNTLKENEEKLNELFIEIYNLKGEIDPSVPDKEITIRKASKDRDIKSFISYAVGCMLGRYSLDSEGIVLAGGHFQPDNYKLFAADVDNVIPILDDSYFEDDMVGRFIHFVRVSFGQETLEENLDFIADALKKRNNETARQCIRRYFLKDFYKDHLKNYQKRPIYWLFDSGKQDGFKALIYVHRYDVGTVAKVRTDYLHALQRKYESEIARIDLLLESDAAQQEKTKARKDKEKLQKQLLECQQYDQLIAHVANQKITIELDDGIKVNYAKFQGLEIPQGEGKVNLKANILASI